MKITACHNFAPYTLTIEVENVEDHDAISAMCQYEHSIPALVAQHEGHNNFTDRISQLLSDLQVMVS
jgi:hypothetical protein